MDAPEPHGNTDRPFTSLQPVQAYNPQGHRCTYQRRTIQEEQRMVSSPSRMAAIFVDRSCTEHWVVRDPEGNFWIVPSVESGWECRRPFQPTEETELDPVPGHY